MQIGRDRNHAILCQLIAQTSHPIGQPENLADHQHDRRFVFRFRINHERFDRAIARFDVDPIGMPRRFVQSIAAEILDLFRAKRLGDENEKKRDGETFHSTKVLATEWWPAPAHVP